jgi:hypothetical protein
MSRFHLAGEDPTHKPSTESGQLQLSYGLVSNRL